jgi:hypothetical protein
LHFRASLTNGATFNYEVNMGLNGESDFEFKGQIPAIPRIAPPALEKFAQELAQASPEFCHPKKTLLVAPPSQKFRASITVYKNSISKA